MTRDEEFLPSIAVAELVGSFDALPSEEANGVFVRLLSEISKDCGAAGALAIGHNKANFRSCDELLSISCTTEDGNVRTKCDFTRPVSDYTGVMNVIVYGLGYPELRGIIETRVSQIPGCSVRVLEDSGCQDPECNDPNCRDPEHRRRPIVIEGM